MHRPRATERAAGGRLARVAFTLLTAAICVNRPVVAAPADEEAAGLRNKIHRLSSVQKQAMEAGSLRARQILFWDTMRGEGDQSFSWRGAEVELPAPQTPATTRGSGSPERLRSGPGMPESPS